ncbi:MAG: carboxymuconolactone decarboxylase family protein [Kiloniellales bacterium]
MARIQAIDPKEAKGKVKELLEGVERALGKVPNLIRTIANSKAALEYYLATGKALSGGILDAKRREQIALAVAGENACDYCASAHTAVGRMVGLDEAELAMNLDGASGDPKVDAALKFAKTVVAKRGFVSNEDIRKVRDAGYDDGAIAEIVANVAHHIFTNYFNHVAETEIDFPAINANQKAAA